MLDISAETRHSLPMTSLSDRTPSDIDTELDGLYFERAKAEADIVAYNKYADQAAERHQPVDRWLAKAADSVVALNNVTAAIRPLQDEWARRPWTRFWLVTNSNGHVHRSTSCDTTYASTSFAWLTQFSGMSHADLVELAGEKACTRCFPDAPVDTLRRASRIKTPEQEAREAEKAQRQSAAQASQVVVEGYRDFGKPRTHTFKTVRGATNDIASNLGSMVGYGPTHPDFDKWHSNVTNTIAALVLKGEVEDADSYYEEALAKARKKCVSEHKKFMKSSAAASYRAQGILDAEVDQPNYNPCKF